MFGDDEEEFQEDVIWSLGTYTFEEILEHNDLDETAVLTILLRDGYIVLPEARPV